MPDCMTFADAFWELEVRHGYDKALEMCCEEFDVTDEDAQRLLEEADALDNGNT